jgi:hypothetical protein
VSNGGLLVVELVAEGQVDSPLVVSEPISDEDGGRIKLKWKEGAGDKELLAMMHANEVKASPRNYQLLFRLQNAALYSFAVNNTPG